MKISRSNIAFNNLSAEKYVEAIPKDNKAYKELEKCSNEFAKKKVKY